MIQGYLFLLITEHNIYGFSRIFRLKVSKFRNIFNFHETYNVFIYYFYIAPAENLNCYVTDKLDVSKVVEEDCHMHTGCLKRYDKRSKYR